MGRLHEELEQLFDDLWRVPRFAGARRGFRPEIDVFRTEDPRELNVVVDVAGVDLEHVHVVVSDRTLVVTGERPREHPQCPRSYYHLEIQYGPFERRIALPESVDAGAARAEYERGLLTIVLPVAERPVPAAKASIPVRRQS
jgi:HSP20 family protein